MVFPLYDDNSDRTTTPIVNYILIALNILVFVFFQHLGNERSLHLCVLDRAAGNRHWPTMLEPPIALSSIR